jgi:hypothetical protein
VAGLSTNQPVNPVQGCNVNVSSDFMTLFADASADLYLNVHNPDYPGGFMRGQLPPWGVVPAGLPTPDQLAIIGAPTAVAPTAANGTNGTNGTGMCLLSSLASRSWDFLFQ